MRIFLILISMILILSACQDDSVKGYKKFLSGDEDTLSILIVENSLDDFQLKEFDENGIEK
jgi:hypothetical protein